MDGLTAPPSCFGENTWRSSSIWHAPRSGREPASISRGCSGRTRMKAQRDTRSTKRFELCARRQVTTRSTRPRARYGWPFRPCALMRKTWNSGRPRESGPRPRRWWPGSFFEGFGLPGSGPFEDWLAAERRHWTERSTHVLLGLCDALLREGRTEAALSAARRADGLDPLDERAARAVMGASALLGDSAAALDHFSRGTRSAPNPRDRLRSRCRHPIARRPHPLRVRRQDTTRRSHPERGGAPTGTIGGPRSGAELLLVHWERCQAGGGAAGLLLVGDSGTGKTRLLEEFLARVADRRVDGSGSCRRRRRGRGRWRPHRTRARRPARSTRPPRGVSGSHWCVRRPASRVGGAVSARCRRSRADDHRGVFDDCGRLGRRRAAGPRRG